MLTALRDGFPAIMMVRKELRPPSLARVPIVGGRWGYFAALVETSISIVMGVPDGEAR